MVHGRTKGHQHPRSSSFSSRFLFGDGYYNLLCNASFSTLRYFQNWFPNSRVCCLAVRQSASSRILGRTAMVFRLARVARWTRFFWFPSSTLSRPVANTKGIYALSLRLSWICTIWVMDYGLGNTHRPRKMCLRLGWMHDLPRVDLQLAFANGRDRWVMICGVNNQIKEHRGLD